MKFTCKTVLAAASVLFATGAFAQTTPQSGNDTSSAMKQQAQSLSHSAPPIKQPAQSLAHEDPDASGSPGNLQKKP